MINIRKELVAELTKHKLVISALEENFSEFLFSNGHSNQSNIDDFDDYIISPNFFDIPKSVILIELPFCENNEIKTVLK